MKNLLLSLVVGAAILSCAPDKSAPAIQENSPRDTRNTPVDHGNSDMKILISSADSPEQILETLTYESSEMSSCHVIPGGKVDIKEDTLEVAFYRGGKKSRNLAEVTILYFPFTESPDPANVLANFSVSLKREGELMNFLNFDSWNGGQDRSLCTIEYHTEGDNVVGVLNCPVQAQKASEELPEKLIVNGSFTCVLQR